jgi:hypothetical protein
LTRAQEDAAKFGSASQISHDKISLWREVFLPYLGTRLILLLVGLLADYYILPLLVRHAILPSIYLNTHFPDALWQMWLRFDAGFYVDIAKNGYWAASTLQSASNWIFLPLYPILMLPLGNLFGRSDAAFYIAGILVSNGAALVAITYLYLLVRRDFNAPIAARTVLYVALFPTSFYLSAIYPEALFLACAVACIYYARQRRWWLAGICGALSSLTRIQGLVLIIPIAWEYWQVLCDRYAPLPPKAEASWREYGRTWLNYRLRGTLLAARSLRNWVAALALVLIPGGMIPFLIYSYFKTGDFLATIDNHSVGWDRQIGFPLRLLAYALLHPLPPNPMEWDFWILNVITVFAFLGFTIWSFRRLPVIYSLYTLVMVLMPLSTGSMKSISRYYLIVFPAMILLALWTDRSKFAARHTLITNLFVALQAVFMAFFVLGLPLIA